MYPVHFPYFDRRRQRVERIMRPSLGSEPVRETAEVAFLDSAELHDGCALDDLVFQGESCLQVANFVRYCPTEGMQLLGCATLILATTERLRRGQSLGFWGSKNVAGQISGPPGVVLNPEFMEGGCTWVTISVLSNLTRLRR
jgi:hypothetical protein